MKYLIFWMLVVSVGCKSQTSTYQAANPPKADTLKKEKFPHPIQPKISKGALQIEGEITSIDDDMLIVKVLDVISMGPGFTSVAPVRGETIALKNGSNYSVVLNSLHLMEVFVNPEDSGSGSLLKLLEEKSSN